MRLGVNFQSPYTATSLPTYMANPDLGVMAVCAYMVSPITGDVIALTSLDVDLTGVPGYPGVTFVSTAGVTASKVEHPEGTSAWNMEADLFLVAAGITEADALAGVWSNAPVTVFVTNYDTLNMGQLQMKGFLSEFRQMGAALVTEIRGFNQSLVQLVGRVTRAECDADLYDLRCGLDAAGRGEDHSGSVTTGTSQTVFRDSSRSETSDYFQNAKGVFTSGLNTGFQFHVDYWDATNKEFTLRMALPYVPQVGDDYDIVRGCRKRFQEDCIAKFDNAENFRGFPGIPDVETFTKLPMQ